MKKTLLSVIIATLSTFALLSCDDEGGMLANPAGINSSDPNGNPGNPNNPNNPNTTPKCYVSEIKNTEDGTSYVTKFTYNSKNLLESRDETDGKTSFEYDANNRITKMNLNSPGIETFTYEYDSKGNMSKIKYFAEGGVLEIDISEYLLTTNAKGQVTKVQAIGEDGALDFFFEYDANNNITKIIFDDGEDKYTLVQNLKFDNKSNAFLNTNLSKAHIPHIIIGALFGVNTTSLFNTNNVLSDSAFSFFQGEEVTTTYDYGYTAEGFPSKMTAMRKSGGETQKEETTYIYTCK
ncbi:hypothetical protein [Emticicia agri]|uniref:DUF4595 domain-containing protein n=1 Tax=Emticicia agri TaxID=2492393 RepID=A0A4Q5M151_9BACT|nr:hypothetical protein [Emticicia agri]RYU95567.1 hypothetical protein EWM59_10670 [Emticicia agri]